MKNWQRKILGKFLLRATKPLYPTPGYRKYLSYLPERLINKIPPFAFDVVAPSTLLPDKWLPKHRN